MILVRVQERTAALDAGTRVHDLVAVNSAPSALDLVLRTEWELGRRRGAICLHEPILRVGAALRKT
jgi:hypothetical protein